MSAGEQLKQIGLDLVESHNPNFVERMRLYAMQYCAVHGSITSDTVRRYAENHNIEPSHPNAWGAVFRGKAWACVGFEPSEIPSNHGRIIRRWSLA